MDINDVLETKMSLGGASKLFPKASVISIDVVVILTLLVTDLTDSRGSKYIVISIIITRLCQM